MIGNAVTFRLRPPGMVPDTFVSFTKDGKFLGVIVVAKPDAKSALQEINRLAINPGGNALCFQVPPNSYPLGRLLSREELEARGAKRMGDLSEDEQFLANIHSARI